MKAPSSPSPSVCVFDRATVRRRRARAAADFEQFDFLINEVGERLIERLDDTTHDFPLALDLGCHIGTLGKSLIGRRGIETVISADMAPAMTRRASSLRLVCDEEALPFAEQSLDLVVSCLSLHWVNDLPGTLVQIRRALKPDGLFIAALLGGETLHELRRCLGEAEIALEGGLSPRLSPATDVRDLGALMQRAGFALPMVDSDTLTVSYTSALGLMRDLRGMGESNATSLRRKSFSRRTTLFDAVERYHREFSDADGRIPATFQVLWLTGWAPSPDQPKAKRPGSATQSLEEALAKFALSDEEPSGCPPQKA